MKWTITSFASRKKWGFATNEQGESIFFHLSNSPGFTPELGMVVEFELAPPFRLGQAKQAVNLRKVEDAQTAQKGGNGVQS